MRANAAMIVLSTRVLPVLDLVNQNQKFRSSNLTQPNLTPNNFSCPLSFLSTAVPPATLYPVITVIINFVQYRLYYHDVGHVLPSVWIGVEDATVAVSIQNKPGISKDGMDDLRSDHSVTLRRGFAIHRGPYDAFQNFVVMASAIPGGLSS